VFASVFSPPTMQFKILFFVRFSDIFLCVNQTLKFHFYFPARAH
jgi:hypothetical protein